MNNIKLFKIDGKTYAVKLSDNLEGVSDETMIQTLQAIREDLKGEYDAIKLYEDHKLFYMESYKTTSNPVFLQLAKVIDDIIDEERTHVGELLALISSIDKTEVDKLNEGMTEVKEIIK